MRMIGSWPVLLLAGLSAALLGGCASYTYNPPSSSPPGGGGGGGNPPPAVTGRLAVADVGDSRVLIFDAPLTDDESASVVLGQPDFTETGQNQTSNPMQPGEPEMNTLNGPAGLTLDSAGNLYVADEENCRVLQFRPPFTSNMSASVIFGNTTVNQPYRPCGAWESSAGAPTPAAESGMDTPVSVALDPQGNLWVVDQWAGRVTEYVPPFRNGMEATVALGQPSLEAASCNRAGSAGGPPPPPTADSLCNPSAVTVDSKGDLWVVDTDNRRVLEFVPPFSTGMPSSLELGQPAAAPFTSPTLSKCDVSASSLCEPFGLAFDSSGNLWVSDRNDNRVVEFVPPFSNGMAAGTVIGQPDFTHGGSYPPAANTLLLPTAVAFDPKGNLMIGDGNGRVLVFSPPFITGMNATLVIGQPGMSSKDQGGPSSACVPPAPAANTLCYVNGILAF